MENLNYLKSLAIVLVVLGHSTNQYKGNWIFETEQKSIIFKWVSLYVNSIHMVIFVFVSGVVYAYCKLKKGYYKHYYNLIKDKVKRLLIPYFCIGLLFKIPIDIFLGIYRGKINISNIIKDLILGINSGHLWFLMMLFILFLVYFCIEKFILKLNVIFSIALVFILQVFSIYASDIFTIKRVLLYCVFFHMGYIVYVNRMFVLDKISILNKKKVIIYTFIIIILLILIRGKISNNSFIEKVIHLIINDIIGILGILQMYSVVAIIKKIKDLQKFLNVINRYNFNIYLLHEPIIFIILSIVINYNPVLVVSFSFIGSIIFSIIFTKIYYLIKV